MDSVDLEVLQKCLHWQNDGHRVALATVVKTWGSSPRPMGSLLAIRDDGLLAGSVSGGCVEADLIERMRTVPAIHPEVLSYGNPTDECSRFRLPCGGMLQLVLEPAPQKLMLQAILDAITHHHRLIGRRLDLASGHATLYTPQTGETTRFVGLTLTSVHGPRWRLLMIGAVQTARCLTQIAQALDYQVSVCDPREEYRKAWSIECAELVPGMPDEAVRAFVPDVHSAVVALSHDPKIDDPALLEALKSPAFYVGSLGSRASNAKRRERLRQDLTEGDVGRLHGPVGLPIGSHTPPEIAVSIMAELTATRHGIELGIVPAARENMISLPHLAVS
ncbi:MAG: XdhC family protein [Sulfuricella sp.]|nr:XdhC family protein [Sulfuricella sp.]